MPWIVGIDEAGYGPNLGPFVMTAVACRVPQPLAEANLWRVLKHAVRRSARADDPRLRVNDSKVVYGGPQGLTDLEAGVLATLSALDAGTLASSLRLLCPQSLPELASEQWFTGQTALPISANPDSLPPAAERFARACVQNEVHFGHVHSVIICPARFNGLIDRWGSKGAVLGHALGELLRGARTLWDDALNFFVDKHGGRNTYAPMVQDALGEGMVVALEEGPERSVYRVLGLSQEMRLTFEPRADASHFCVALASMVSKYIREACMIEFNRFWTDRVPGLKPTAGYPGDARRFYNAIKPAASQLGIPEVAVWRRK